MISKTQMKFASYSAILLFVIGFFCYAAFPSRPPDEPIRIMFHSNAGKVLFGHKTHTSIEGYGVSCQDCHHHPPDDESALQACGYCHQLPAEGEDFPESCLDCHDLDEIEGSEVIKRSNAFHDQCRSCHVEFGAGPGDSDDACNDCHVL